MLSIAKYMSAKPRCQPNPVQLSLLRGLPVAGTAPSIDQSAIILSQTLGYVSSPDTMVGHRVSSRLQNDGSMLLQQPTFGRASHAAVGFALLHAWITTGLKVTAG